jgi:coproporphyrinogen III oxidase-like Fe-S oxidoreductase
MHQQELDGLQQNLEQQKKNLIVTYEGKQIELQKELSLRMKVELHEIEERKNQHINDLMINHETAFREMKQYYNDITKENLDIIKQLQDKYQDVKLQIQNSELVVTGLKASVLELQGPLAAQRIEKARLEKSVANYDVNAMGLRNAKGSLEDI